MRKIDEVVEAAYTEIIYASLDSRGKYAECAYKKPFRFSNSFWGRKYEDGCSPSDAIKAISRSPKFKSISALFSQQEDLNIGVEYLYCVFKVPERIATQIYREQIEKVAAFKRTIELRHEDILERCAKRIDLLRRNGGYYLEINYNRITVGNDVENREILVYYHSEGLIDLSDNIQISALTIAIKEYYEDVYGILSNEYKLHFSGRNGSISIIKIIKDNPPKLPQTTTSW